MKRIYYLPLKILSALLCIMSSCGEESKNSKNQDRSPHPNSIKLPVVVSTKKNPAANKNDTLEISLKNYVSEIYLKSEELKLLNDKERKFSYEEVDLNSDSKKEIFISFSSPYFCGSGGCTVLLLNSNMKLINRFSVMRTPLFIDSTTHSGWKALWLQEGKSWKMLMYNDGKYPSNPSLIKLSEKSPESIRRIILDPQKSRFISF